MREGVQKIKIAKEFGCEYALSLWAIVKEYEFQKVFSKSGYPSFPRHHLDTSLIEIVGGRKKAKGNGT